MKASVKYNLIKFDDFETNLKSAAEEIMTNAIKVFTMATASKIPLWSGQARATLQKVAHKYDVSLDYGAPHRSETKSWQTGSRFGNTSSTYNRGVFTFEWSTTLSYLVDSEYNKSVSPSSPWHSTQYGVTKAKSVITSVYGLAIKNALLASITYSIN